MAEKALELDHVGIKFNLSKEKVDSLKEYVIKLLKRSFYIMNFGRSRTFPSPWRKGNAWESWA